MRFQFFPNENDEDLTGLLRVRMDPVGKGSLSVHQRPWLSPFIRTIVTELRSNCRAKIPENSSHCPAIENLLSIACYSRWYC